MPTWPVRCWRFWASGGLEEEIIRSNSGKIYHEERTSPMATETVTISTRERARIVRTVCKNVRANYVFPQQGRQIAARLLQHLKDGEYEDIPEGETFALAMTIHLQEVNQDEHLWVRWHAQAMPEGEELLRQNQAWREEQQLEARLRNYGFCKVERLPGNVGYLDLRYLYRPEWGGEAAAAAMTLLANTHALIIDLRNCPGGYPGMIELLCTYLFGETPVHLSSIYWRDEDITQQYWTLPHVPGERFGAEKPVFVLTGKDTFSGGEALAIALQSRGRAVIVGERTDGGAHPTTTTRIHPHFELSVPIGRTFDPLTGEDWEKKGVSPEISVPAEVALEAAYALSLKAVIAALGWPESRILKLLLLEARKALQKLKG